MEYLIFVDEPKILPGLRMNWNMKISICQVYGDSPVVDHNRLTDLTVSILNGCFLLVKKDLLLDVTFHSFLVQGIVRSKSWEFPGLVSFPLPISGEEF